MKTNEFVLRPGLCVQLESAFERNGWTPAEVNEITKGENLSNFLKVVRGHATIQLRDYIIDCSTPVFTPEGWSVLPDKEQLPNRVLGQVKFDPSKVKLHLDEGQRNGKRIQGNELRKKLVNEPVYTAHILDYLLKPENQHLIPEEWKGKAIFFWGTIYRVSYGHLYVRYLHWSGSRWYWHYDWLDYAWYDSHPSAVLASS